MTPLDQAFAAMDAAPEDDALRLRYYERLADCELFLLLEREPDGDNIDPQIFELEEGQFVLGFDRAERLSAFMGREAPYAALSGRSLVRLLAAQGLGLGVNLEVADSAYLLPSEVLSWLVDVLERRPEAKEMRVREVAAPGAMPELLLSALDAKLALMGAAARIAYLAKATYEDGTLGHMLAFVEPAPGAESALSQAASEALTFSGLEAGQLDVTFLNASDPVAAQLARVALRFDLPEPPKPQIPGAPGMNPEKPPKLR